MNTCRHVNLNITSFSARKYVLNFQTLNWIHFVHNHILFLSFLSQKLKRSADSEVHFLFVVHAI